MDHSEAILRLCLKKGWNPANLSAVQNRFLAAAVRSPVELAKDAARAGISYVATKVGVRNVPDWKRDANRLVCEAGLCGKYQTLTIKGKVKRNGVLVAASTRFEPGCMACNCQGRLLIAKWTDASESCPLGYWTNLETPHGDIKADQVITSVAVSETGNVLENRESGLNDSQVHRFPT